MIGGWLSRNRGRGSGDDDAIRARADQQHRWALRGDDRGVFGTGGAEAMRDLGEMPGPGGSGPPGPDLEVAGVVHTPEQLRRMLADTPPCWRYAAFVSVLVQRRAAVQTRVRDARIGFTARGPEAIRTDGEVALFFSERLAELDAIVGAIDSLLLSPGFQQAFGRDEQSADGEAIVHSAHRLMDHHDRLLALSERCRAVRVPALCADVQRDVAALTALPLEAFHTFIADFTDRLAEMADVARYGTGIIWLDPVEFKVEDPEGIIDRVSRRLRHLARG